MMEYNVHEPVFAGYIWGLVSQNLIPALKNHGYRIDSSENIIQETRGSWELKVYLRPIDEDLDVKDTHNAAMEIQCQPSISGQPLKIKSSEVNFMLVLEIGEKLGINNLKQLRFETKQPKLVELIETFINEAVTKMLKEAKNIP